MWRNEQVLHHVITERSLQRKEGVAVEGKHVISDGRPNLAPAVLNEADTLHFPG